MRQVAIIAYIDISLSFCHLGGLVQDKLNNWEGTLNFINPKPLQNLR